MQTQIQIFLPGSNFPAMQTQIQIYLPAMQLQIQIYYPGSQSNLLVQK